jgi:hypothetical protein
MVPKNRLYHHGSRDTRSGVKWRAAHSFVSRVRIILTWIHSAAGVTMNDGRDFLVVCSEVKTYQSYTQSLLVTVCSLIYSLLKTSQNRQ